MHPQFGARRPRRADRAQPGAAQSAAALSDDSLDRIHQRHRALRDGRRRSRGESITHKVKELTNGQGASVLAELAPGGIETTIECIRNLEPGGRVALIAPNPEPLNLPLRYLMIRSIEFTSVTGRFAMDVADLAANRSPTK